MDTQLEVFARARDGRRIFLAVYRAMTATMARNLPAGAFLDAAWTRTVTVNFAELYFEAVDAYEAGSDDCPRIWRRVFDAAGSWRVLALENALLGINAHITYDLPRAVARTMRQFGDHLPPDAEDGPPLGIMARRRYDYEVVNFLLAQTTDVVQDLLARRFTPLVAVVDLVAGRFDEYVAEVLLRYAREQGWHVAVALAYADTPDEEHRILGHLEAVALDFAHRIDLLEMIPTSTARRLAHVFRAPFVDSDDVSRRRRRYRRLGTNI